MIHDDPEAVHWAISMAMAASERKLADRDRVMRAALAAAARQAALARARDPKPSIVDVINRNHRTVAVMIFAAFGWLVGIQQPAWPGLLMTAGPLVIFVAAALTIWIDYRANDPNPSRKEAQRLSEASERARLTKDCDDQHAALQRGDWAVAMYGRFPPPEPPIDVKLIDELAVMTRWHDPGLRP